MSNEAEIHSRLPNRRGNYCHQQFDQSSLTPAQIDRLADQELFLGHHELAERLSRKASEMREARAGS
jgi:hypothetical protein